MQNQVEVITRSDKADNIKLPAFDGNESNLTAEQFIIKTEGIMKMKGYSATTVMGGVVQAFQGNAARWLEVATKTMKPWVDNWESFKPEFLARFKASTPFTQKIRLLCNLNQDPTPGKESVLDFYDRLQLAFLETTEEGRPEKDEKKKEGFRMYEAIITKAFFIAGLRPDIRPIVERQVNQDMDIEEILELAKTTETTAKKVCHNQLW